VKTDRFTPNNKPDITGSKIKKGTCMLGDTEISGDINVLRKEAPKYFKI
jgi:hypothetical protein